MAFLNGFKKTCTKILIKQAAELGNVGESRGILNRVCSSINRGNQQCAKIIECASTEIMHREGCYKDHLKVFQECWVAWDCVNMLGEAVLKKLLKFWDAAGVLHLVLTHGGNIRVVLGLSWDNGEENGNYWGYIGIMRNFNVLCISCKISSSHRRFLVLAHVQPEARASDE